MSNSEDKKEHIRGVNLGNLCHQGRIRMKTSFRKFFRFLPIAIILSLVVILMACSSSPTSSATSSSTTSGNTVTIANFAFSPATLTVNVGSKVTWTNTDSVTHTVTSDNGVFGSGDLAPNATFSYTFNTTGTFAYHCSIHTYMTGTVIVH